MPLNSVELEVTVSSSAMLKLLWQAGLSKGHLTVETPNEVPVGVTARVCLVTPVKRIALDGVVHRCSRHASSFSVDVAFADIGSNPALAAELV